MKAVILAGGKGTRLTPYTKILPKPLMPIGDLPILEILLRQMKQAGVDEVILTVGHMAHLLRSFFLDGDQFGLQIHYSYEDQPLGTAGPLSLIKDLDDTFLVSNGDILTNLNIGALVDSHKKSGAIATIAAHQRKIEVDLGVIQVDGGVLGTNGNRIINYIEKPVYPLLVSMGIYVFEPRVLRYIPYNRHLDFPDLVLHLIQAGELVVSYPFGGYWQDLGRPDDYEKAVHDFESLRMQILGQDNL